MSLFGGQSTFEMSRGGGASAAFQGGNRASVLGRQYQPFANPFFDLASTYTPPTVKALFGFCRHFHLTHGIINAINTRTAEYPVTELLLTHRDKGVKDRWQGLMHDSLNYRVRQIEANLDYAVYGNAFLSPNFPFTKYLTCKSCRKEHPALRTRRNWRYTSHGFWLSCPSCGQSDYAKAADRSFPRLDEIGLTRWNPENVTLVHNETTDYTETLLDFSADFRNAITMGRKDLVATTPQAILEAVKLRRMIVLDRSAVFHMRRPSPSHMMSRWGVPSLMPVLKDVYYMQIMKKSQESVLLQHIIPQVFLFPQPATAAADPFTTTNLTEWREHLRRELTRQRMDPGYYGILPFPLGHQTIGENGKSLLLQPEIQSMAEQIVVGMGWHIDLIFGSGTYSGSSVTMRMMENAFISNVHAHRRLVQWVLKHYSAFLGWPLPGADFKPFHMADDVQRQALLLQANQSHVVSDTALLSHLDLTAEQEAERMISELQVSEGAARRRATLAAEIAGEAMVVQSKYEAVARARAAQAQMREQAAPMSPFDQAMDSGLGAPQGISVDALSAALAKEIRAMPPERAQAWLSQLRSQAPELAQAVSEHEGEGMPPAPPQQEGSAPAVDMRPMPEKLPPRRASLA